MNKWWQRLWNFYVLLKTTRYYFDYSSPSFLRRYLATESVRNNPPAKSVQSERERERERKIASPPWITTTFFIALTLIHSHNSTRMPHQSCKCQNFHIYVHSPWVCICASLSVCRCVHREVERNRENVFVCVHVCWYERKLNAFKDSSYWENLKWEFVIGCCFPIAYFNSFLSFFDDEYSLARTHTQARTNWQKKVGICLNWQCHLLQLLAN